MELSYTAKIDLNIEFSVNFRMNRNAKLTAENIHNFIPVLQNVKHIQEFLQAIDVVQMIDDVVMLTKPVIGLVIEKYSCLTATFAVQIVSAICAALGGF